MKCDNPDQKMCPIYPNSDILVYPTFIIHKRVRSVKFGRNVFPSRLVVQWLFKNLAIKRNLTLKIYIFGSARVLAVPYSQAFRLFVSLYVCVFVCVYVHNCSA